MRIGDRHEDRQEESKEKEDEAEMKADDFYSLSNTWIEKRTLSLRSGA